MKFPPYRLTVVALALVLPASDPACGFGDDVTPALTPSAARSAEIELVLLQSVLDETSGNSQGSRYFVCQIRCTNHSAHERTLLTENWRLSVDGQILPPQFEPAALQDDGIALGREMLRIRDLQQHRELSLAPQESASTWLIFTDLPHSGAIPKMVLETALGDGLQQIDVNETHRLRLRLESERIGPRQVLGLLTVRGALDTVNVGSLIEELDRLSNQGVSHAVINFTESAAPLPDLLFEWLKQTAQDRARSRLQDRFPAISPLIRELHLAAVPGHETEVGETLQGRAHVHRSAAAAVEASLESAVDHLSADAIMEQIESGHPLVRAAALAIGGRQFGPEHLPLILRLADGDDPVLQRGALLALGESGEPAAISALERHARSDSAAAATLAVECLAASRFAAAQDALERVLADSNIVPLADLVRILARYPRDRWLMPLERLASGDWRQDGASNDDQATIRRDALLALDRIGHPKLVELLAAALAAEHEVVRETAFSLLVKRMDPESEQLALDYALELTRTAFPTPQVLTVFQRVRDPRAVPLLIDHLGAADADRGDLIKTLALIGNDSIDEVLFEHYNSLPPREQQLVLNLLGELGSQHALTLAEQGLQSDLNATFSTAVGILQEQGSTEAVAILSKALSKGSTAKRARSIAGALCEIGTADALLALRSARYAGDEQQEAVIASKLREILQRSPAAPLYEMAQRHVENEAWNEAIEGFTLVLEIDPELSDAVSGRGHCRLHLNHLTEAAGDFRDALRRNPYDGLAVTGLAIVQVREGRVDDGIKTVEEARGRFPRDLEFAYNSACVYSRVIESLAAKPADAAAAERVTELQKLAIGQLRLAVERGFVQFDYMKRDPDLAPLRQLEAFKQLDAAQSAPESADEREQR